MVGLEALHMQGLPIDELLLTRETEDQLADLAGNAMSTTVVGTAILAALILGHKLLKEGDAKTTYEGTSTIEEMEEDSGAMDVDAPAVGDHITGEDQLTEQPLDLSTTVDQALPLIIAHSMRSVRLCECEGRKDITERQLNRCKDCGWTSCTKCGGRPEHNYEAIDVIAEPRVAPSIFNRSFKSFLPMCLIFSDVTAELLDSLREQADVSIPSKRWSAWRSAVSEAAKLELRFVETKRQEIWSATYESDKARLELYLHSGRPEWYFFAKPESSEPANAEIRKILLLPAARLVCEDALLKGQWEFALPHTMKVNIMIKGVGELVPSWQTKLGLQLDQYKDSTVYSQLQVTVDQADVSHFDRDITGVYTLLDQCGTANSALHKKYVSDEEASQPPLFMLMDPSRCGNTADDGFVFASSIRRYEYGEARPVVARLDSEWRQSNVSNNKPISCSIPQKYVAAVGVQLKVSLYISSFTNHVDKSILHSHRHSVKVLVMRFLTESSRFHWRETPAKPLMPCLLPASPSNHKRVLSGLVKLGRKSSTFTSVLPSDPCLGWSSGSKPSTASSIRGRLFRFMKVMRTVTDALHLLPRFVGSKRAEVL